MKRNETIEIYSRRIEAAIEFIDGHLDEELGLASIAGAAHFSPFHFHRIFRAFRGEPLGAYITRHRVETAARLLRHSDLSVEAIAYNVGFGVPSSLTKAFQRFYKITPSEYRSGKNIQIKNADTMKTTQTTKSVKLRAPKIVDIEPKTALCISMKGDYKNLDFSAAFARMWALVKKQGLYSAGIEHIGVYLNDPKMTDAADLLTDICLVVKKPAVPEDGIVIRTIAGGRYAVFTHTGPYDEAGAVYDAIYGEWVPANCPCKDECVCEDEECACGCKSGEPCTCPPDDCRCALRDEPVFEKYISDPKRIAPEKLKTEIYIPIK